MATSTLINDTLSAFGVNASQTNASIGHSYYAPKVDECTLLARLIIHTIVGGTICFLGFAGNALSCIVLRRDTQTPVASLLLQTLALADSFFLSLWFIHFSVVNIFDYERIDQYSHKYWMYTRLYSYPFLFIGQTATIWLTVLIAATRFIAICIPYRASQLCNIVAVRKWVVFVCIFSVVYNLPRFFDTYIVHVQFGNEERYHFASTRIGLEHIYRLIYGDIMYYIFSFILPLLILAVLNTKLTIAYRRVQQRRQHLRGSQDHKGAGSASGGGGGGGGGHSDPNITLVMIIVVLVFMLCNLPARIVQMVWNYTEQPCESIAFFIKEISNVLEVLNSSTNFIIYCAFRQQFRDILSQQLCSFASKKSARSNGEKTKNDITMHTLLNGNGHANDPPIQDKSVPKPEAV